MDWHLPWYPRHSLADLGADGRHGFEHILAVAGYIFLDEGSLWVVAANLYIINGKSSYITISFNNLNFL